MMNSNINTSSLNFSQVKKPPYATKLNLVALMDIFTILVFFLLLNSGDADQLENAKFVKLPDSSAGAAPHVEASILIGETEIWLNNEVVLTVDDALNSTAKVLEPLANALEQYTTDKGELNAYEKENGLAITIMGDQAVSFSLLERVMATCSAKNFRDISLAVNRVAAKPVSLSAGEPPSLASQSGGG
ncbi:biopolymer transporter ExbD [Pleionea sp. CnH1-48]|uniref:ExbD/TolR family protein n=1 Tax=Pleionea sp. CnH1-48 TaxID=2954494 RepID=UPI002096EFEE|nr:biopolymer transporter ExbD [Pleionea sp. CnH1-48]MCO7223231.1 biopolymer transporter ExbD [Pleionea sp. CnH1-48]